jgi:hypothetical protein
MRDDAVGNLFRISAFIAHVQSRPAFRFVMLMVPAATTRCIDVVMVFDLYVAGEFYFGTNAASWRTASVRQSMRNLIS